MLRTKETIGAFTRIMQLNDSRVDPEDLKYLAALIVEAVESWIAMNVAKTEFYKGGRDA